MIMSSTFENDPNNFPPKPPPAWCVILVVCGLIVGIILLLINFIDFSRG